MEAVVEAIRDSFAPNDFTKAPVNIKESGDSNGSSTILLFGSLILISAAIGIHYYFKYEQIKRSMRIVPGSHQY